MPDNALTEKSRSSLAGGAVKKLIRYDNVAGSDTLFHAPDSGNGDDPPHTEFLHGIYIGPIGNFRREKAVPATMPGQKNHADITQQARYKNIRGISEWSLNPNLLDLAETFDFIEATASDNSQNLLSH
jgi:hypothetical protein